MQLDLSKVVTLDFETFYDGDYSLRSKEMNTSEYIRDERFVAHCVGIKHGEEPTRVYWYDEIRPAIEAICWADSHLLCHNTAFDGLILSHHYGVVPPSICPRTELGPGYDCLYLDTLSMARALHAGMTRANLAALAEFYGAGSKIPNVLGKMKGHREIPLGLRAQAEAYTTADVDLCFTIFKRMIEVYPEAEIRLVDWTVRQFCDPVLFVDVPRAQAELERERTKKSALLEKAGLDEEQLQSASKFAAQLRSLGVEPPMKLSARTKLFAYAFSQQDDEFMALCSHDDERVRDLMAARLATKSTIAETRAERFVKVGSAPLPVGLNYFGAHTGRWSGGNRTNLQNLERDGELRKSIIAPPGMRIVVADSKQIECRMLAWLAGQNDLLALFESGADPYCALASEAFGREITKADRDERAVGKAAVLGLGFYMGAPRFQGSLAAGILGPKLHMPLDFCQSVVDTYRRKNGKIRALWRDMELILYRMLMKRVGGKPDECTQYRCLEYDAQTIWLPNGMGLHYPDLRAEWNERRDRFEDFTYRSNKEYVRVHAGILTENVIQALARVVIGEQLLRINERYRVVMMTHDEIVALAQEHEADECLAFMLREMAAAPAWAAGLPLEAEGGHDVCYSK